MARHRITILGKGCPRCFTTDRLIRAVVAQCGADVEVVKVTDLAEMERRGVTATPTVTIDDQLVHAGSVPSREQVQRWVDDLKGIP